MKKYLFASIWVLSTVILNAQITNSNVITISVGTEVTFDAGDFTNSGSLSNGGTLRANGDWSSLGANGYSGSGVLILNGLNQVVTNTSTISNLTIDGEAGGVKGINSDLNVSEVLQLSNGIINARAADVILASGGSIAGGSVNSYIDGVLYQTVGLAGNRLVYPIGSNNGYLPLTLSNLQGLGSLGALVNDFPLIASLDSIQRFAPYHYEILTDMGGAEFNESIVTMSLSGLDFAPDKTVILQSDNAGSILASSVLQVSVSGENVTSVLPATKLLVAPAEKAEIRISIMNVMTPNDDEVNSILFIRNIDKFAKNEVKIINRWGAKVAGFTNYNNTTVSWNGRINGKFAAPGNYICVVKDTETGLELGKQTISIIR